MTKPLRVALEIIIKSIEAPKTVLEIGSRQPINQDELANLRFLFPESKYIGSDIQSGKGVDVITDASNLPFKNNSFDMVLCLETLEHSNKPWLIASEIERVVKNDGCVLISSQQNFPIHMHPSDYFRFTPMGLKSLFPKIKRSLVFSISPPFGNEVKLNPQQVVLVGINNNDGKVLSKIKRALRVNVDKISVHKPYRHRIIDSFRLIKRAFEELLFKLEIEFF